MTVIFAAFRLFPFWAIPLGIVLLDIGKYFRRKTKPSQWVAFSISAVLFTLTAIWIFFRGDLNSERWVRAVFGL